MSNWNRLYRHHFYKNVLVITFGTGSFWMQCNWLKILFSVFFHYFNGSMDLKQKVMLEVTLNVDLLMKLTLKWRKTPNQTGSKKYIRIEMPVRFFFFYYFFFLHFSNILEEIPFPWMNNFSMLFQLWITHTVYGKLYNNFNSSYFFCLFLIEHFVFESLKLRDSVTSSQTQSVCHTQVKSHFDSQIVQN